MDKPTISNNIIYLLIGDNNEKYKYKCDQTWICFASKSKKRIEEAKLENEKWAERVEQEYFPSNYKKVENRYDLVDKIDRRKLMEDKSVAPYDPDTHSRHILTYNPVIWCIEEVKEII